MTLKKRGLGKGLDALLSHSNAASRKSDQAEEQQSTPLSDLLHLDLDLLQPGKYKNSQSNFYTLVNINLVKICRQKH